MSKDKFNVVKEKIQYLITSVLQEKDFNVLDIDLFIDTYIPQTTGIEEPEPMIESYELFLNFDYNGRIDSYEAYSFTRDISIMLERLEEGVSQFTLTEEGKIVRDNKNINVSSPFILNIDFKHEELHKFDVSFRFDYYE